MKSVLIAYNNNKLSELSDFFEACADAAKQACADGRINFDSVCPPDLSESKVVELMKDHQLCFIAAHGNSSALYNDLDQKVVSVDTESLNFENKGFYSVACSCATNLHPHLRTQGVKLFVGYNDTFITKGDIEPFVNSAMSGLVSLLSGDDIELAKSKMYKIFDDQIDLLKSVDVLAASLLLHNKESLVFEWDETFVL